MTFVCHSKVMTEKMEMEKRRRTPRRKLVGLNDQLTCRICSGYLIDATTITDCIHSFCRVCLVRHLESSGSCPICGRPVYLGQPGQSSEGNVRLDHKLQDIVYKLVPNLFAEERMRRRLFLLGANKTEDQQSGPLSPDTTSRLVNLSKISLVLARTVCTQPDADSRQQLECTSDIVYLQCPASLTISVLKKFIRCKMDLEKTSDCEIWIYHRDLFLKDYYTLLDVAETYDWNMTSPLNLFFMVRQSSETLSSVADVLMRRSSISSSSQLQQQMNRKRLHVKIDLTGDRPPPHPHPPVTMATHHFKRRHRKGMEMETSSQSPADISSCSLSWNKGSGNRLPVLQTIQSSRSETLRERAPLDDRWILSGGKNVDHLLSTASSSSSVIGSCSDAGSGRHGDENRTRTKTLSKKEMLLSKLRSQARVGSSNSSPGHVTSESDVKRFDCTPTVSPGPTLLWSSSRNTSQVSPSHVSRTTLGDHVRRIVQTTPDENCGLPLKKRMFFGDHWRSSSSRRTSENIKENAPLPSSSIGSSWINDVPPIPSDSSSSASVVRSPLRDDFASSLRRNSSVAAGVSSASVPLRIYEDKSETSLSQSHPPLPPPAKIGIVISRGRAMTLQDRQTMLDKSSSNPSESSGSLVVSGSSSSTARKIPILASDFESENNIDAETRNFWWKKRSQMETKSATSSHYSDLRRKESEAKLEWTIADDSLPQKTETTTTMKRRHRGVLRVRGNTPVNDHTTTTT